MDKWRAECLVPKWSAMSPLSVAEDGCIGSVLKNTFVHITPPPVTLRRHAAQRRCRSVPKDMGSTKNIWDATRHVFKFAPATCSRQHTTTWAELSEAACDVDLQESTAAPESDGALDEGAGGDEDWHSWWDEGCGQTSQRHNAHWQSASTRKTCRDAWKAEKWWQESSSGKQHWHSNSREAANGSWWTSMNQRSDRLGISNVWQKSSYRTKMAKPPRRRPRRRSRPPRTR